MSPDHDGNIQEPNIQELSIHIPDLLKTMGIFDSSKTNATIEEIYQKRSTIARIWRVIACGNITENTELKKIGEELNELLKDISRNSVYSDSVISKEQSLFPANITSAQSMVRRFNEVRRLITRAEHVPTTILTAMSESSRHFPVALTMFTNLLVVFSGVFPAIQLSLTGYTIVDYTCGNHLPALEKSISRLLRFTDQIKRHAPSIIRNGVWMLRFACLGDPIIARLITLILFLTGFFIAAYIMYESLRFYDRRKKSWIQNNAGNNGNNNELITILENERHAEAKEHAKQLLLVWLPYLIGAAIGYIFESPAWSITSSIEIFLTSILQLYIDHTKSNLWQLPNKTTATVNTANSDETSPLLTPTTRTPQSSALFIAPSGNVTPRKPTGAESETGISCDTSCFSTPAKTIPG
ncbi:MAG: hypothetical protein A3C44_02560 [Gammaproteobacteria bacterium RIFCSPHIGHO2_02_FULL_39_13]|nr:MAG: hypothetical protein A3C44_02560 [Gammaproteobacteria bacterium RIFCSPHIGHO2_02_FULL_39_13]OGT50150.1 MAG: hypothetical protein A3E53_01865 [Gammaproteobacteria bacterium RIFCSPHIGHO2_12_FULL_39_24]